MHPYFDPKHLVIFILTFTFSFVSLKSDAQKVSRFIVVDQFGYLPSSKKIAVIRDPQIGYDASESFTPGNSYSLVDKVTGQKILTGNPTVWNGGSTDESSGDKVWQFNFSSVSTPGTYYILDVDQNLRSYEFEISSEVYNTVLKHAVRTFFYQRAGFEKKAQYAGSEWADGASHTGPLQDKNARQYNDKNNSSKERDLNGAWYDAGDYHRYTNWTANYVSEFMRAYMEVPSAWADDYNIPESGNGLPDILDEAKWGVDHLLRMQNSDGSVLSILNVSHSSPPSSAKGQSVYGTPSTSASLNTAAAFAMASKVYASQGMKDYADTLKARSIKAWKWAEANPLVIFKNNDASSGTAGIGGGQQETDDYGRFVAKMEVACYLFELTGDIKYKTFIENNYKKVHLMEWNYGSLFELTNNEVLLYYAKLPGVDPAIASHINTTYKNAMNGSDNLGAHINNADPYLAYISYYGWGSNSMKSLQGLMFTDLNTFQIDPSKKDEALRAAESYIHYIHGVNPLNITYLSNMYKYGGDSCVNEFYHTWFTNGSTKWDRVGTSTYGPPPGFLSGGPNPTYNWDGCCPSGCGGSSTVCNSESISPPKGQPKQKSYKDFNTSWPLNSWEVTENSDSYQINYIRLLSKFITTNYDCSGTKDGTATYDICKRCTGGNTGKTPITNPAECSLITSDDPEKKIEVYAYPNPSDGIINIVNEANVKYRIMIVNSTGQKILSTTNYRAKDSYNICNQPSGIYFVIIDSNKFKKSYKIIRH